MSETGKGRQRADDQEILAATPRNTGGKEAQVGLFVILGVVSFIIVLFWMTDPATFRGRYMLVSEVTNAGGVRPGDPIQMRGVNVGRVGVHCPHGRRCRTSSLRRQTHVVLTQRGALVSKRLPGEAYRGGIVCNACQSGACRVS